MSTNWNIARILLLTLTLMWTGCAVLKHPGFFLNPQAAVDSIDRFRERNERAIFAQCAEAIQDRADLANASFAMMYDAKGSTYDYCDIVIDPDQYPVTLAVYGLPYSSYRTTKEGRAVITYNLGDHHALAHEMAHSIMLINVPRLSDDCKNEMLAISIADDIAHRSEVESVDDALRTAWRGSR